MNITDRRTCLLYTSVLGNKTIVTNGDQTDTIYDGLDDELTFEQSLRSRQFEPDGPNSVSYTHLLDYSFFQPGYVGLGYSQAISHLLLSLFYPTYGVYSIPQFYDCLLYTSRCV